MSQGRSNTVREALVSQALEEIDGILARMESLTANVTSAQESVKPLIQALAEATQKYQAAVKLSTEQAKAEFAEYVQRQAVLSKEQNEAALQKAAESALRQHFANLAHSSSPLASPLLVAVGALIGFGIAALTHTLIS